jgi:hypothetical protein
MPWSFHFCWVRHGSTMCKFNECSTQDYESGGLLYWSSFAPVSNIDSQRIVHAIWISHRRTMKCLPCLIWRILDDNLSPKLCTIKHKGMPWYCIVLHGEDVNLLDKVVVSRRHERKNPANPGRFCQGMPSESPKSRPFPTATWTSGCVSNNFTPNSLDIFIHFHDIISHFS